MKRFALIAFHLLTINNMLSQVWHGTIINSETREQLEFVNIGVLHKNKGTVTNEGGEFSLNLTSLSDNDTIRISYVGYESTDLLIQHCRKCLLNNLDFLIELTPSALLIKAIEITSYKTKTKISGNNIKSSLITGGFMSNELGAELGTVLKYHKKKKGFVKNVNFNITSNEYDTLFFRINL